MILQIDAGNTRIKWRVLEASGVVTEGNQLTASLFSGEPLLLPVITGLTRGQISNVAGEEVVVRLCKQLGAQFGIGLEVAEVSRQVGGVSCGYLSPEKLGVDRWMAVLAAFKRTGRATVVVDAGSAVTVDVVNAQGAHKGGYIVPGLRLLQQSLWQGTKNVKVDKLASDNVYIAGTSTEEAVSKGCTLILVTLIERLVAEHRAELVITGGDALLLAAQLAARFDYCADLVLDGLSVEGVCFSAAASR